MNRWAQFALAVVAATALACGDADRRANETAAPGAGTPGTAGTAGAADVERDFIEDQLGDGQAEVELGRLAQERASNAEVKEFAERMVRHHQEAGQELKQIASKHNIQLGEGERNEHNDLRERLSELKGAEFDREYMKAMVDEHQEAVNEVERRAENADNPEVRQWASKTLPTLRQHLESARQINEKLEQRQ